MSAKYKSPKMKHVYMAQLASFCYREQHNLCLNSEVLNHNYTKVDTNNTIVGITEDLLCKKAFNLLDQCDHQLIHVARDGNAIYYQLGNIIHEEGESEILIKGKN